MKNATTRTWKQAFRENRSYKEVILEVLKEEKEKQQEIKFPQLYKT